MMTILIDRHHNGVFFNTESVKRNDGTTTASVRKTRVDFNTAWRAALKRPGIEDFRFHDLRQTWASGLIQAGVPLSALQEMGGWESIEMLRRYAHLAPNHLTEHARKIDSLLGENDTNMTQGDNQAGLRRAKVVEFIWYPTGFEYRPYSPCYYSIYICSKNAGAPN